MIIVYVTLLIVLGIIEASQIYNIAILLYSNNIAMTLSISIVAIYVIVSISINNLLNIFYSIIMFTILLSSYYNIVDNKIREIHEVKNNRITMIDNKIDDLRKKYFLTKKQTCNDKSHYYASCLYVSSLELKSLNINKEIIDNEIRKLQDSKQDIINEELDYTQVYRIAMLSILISLFISISIFILTKKLKEKISKNQTERINELLQKGYTMKQVSTRMKLSRATIYRRKRRCQ